MFARILILLLVVPLVELVLLFRIGGWIGFFPTAGLLILTAILGSVLVKREGLSVWRRFQERLTRGELPGDQIVDGMIVLASGVMLISPGVITDVIGILGLIPLTRIPIRRLVLKRMAKGVSSGAVRMTFGSWGAGSTGNTTGDESGWQGHGQERPRHTGREPEIDDDPRLN